MRTILAVGRKRDVLEGAGETVGRVLPQARLGLEPLDPFLLLDHFKAKPGGPGFPPHPHRGFEILTYILQGWGEHEDDQGNKGRIEAGGLMRLTAGSGMWHGEAGGAGPSRPAQGTAGASGQAPGDGDYFEGLQFWVNLPKAKKKVRPAFQLARDSEFPRLRQSGGAKVKVLVGEGSPIKVLTPMVYLHVDLEPGAAFEWELDEGHQGFIYALKGGLKLGAEGADLAAEQVAVLGEGGGLGAHNPGREAAAFLLAAGRPHKEPVIWNGPFVD